MVHAVAVAAHANVSEVACVVVENSSASASSTGKSGDEYSDHIGEGYDRDGVDCGVNGW